MKHFLNKYKNIIFKIIFTVLSIILIIPSVMYLIRNGTILGFTNYYNFFINDGQNKTISTIVYLGIFIVLTIIYLCFIKKNDFFKNIKQVLIYTGVISAIFIAMLPWTSSDIFYYMGVGELNSVYAQNPYYVTIKEYCNENKEKLNDDTIMKQGYKNYWAGTTVVYGPIAQVIFSIVTKISFRNVDICLILFKLLNLLMHLLNAYLIYKITKKLKFVIIYGLNPFILLEFIGNVHNDIIVVFFILLSIYFLLKKKKILPSIIALAIATGIKYFTILLLPVIVLYHFRNEEKLEKRFLKCIQYGVIFLVLFILEYVIYFRDMSIFTAMMVQNERLSKSIYSGIVGYGELKGIEKLTIFSLELTTIQIAIILRNTMFLIFIITYIKFCIDLLITKNIKLNKTLRKYNPELILFLLSLTTFQQWYILWLFATLWWQRPNTIRNIIGVSLVSEIANSVYMFQVESFRYDIYFWGIIFIFTIKKMWSMGTCLIDRIVSNDKKIK